MSQETIRQKEHWKFRWSHQGWLHRYLVRTYNFLIQFVPFSIKYAVGKQLREGSMPYVLVPDARVAVQVGAPQDTLKGARSRGMYFTLFSKPEHQVVVIEPDSDSTDTMKRFAAQQKLDNLTVISKGAWSEHKQLKLYINDAHPASNFTEGTVEYDEERLREYRVVEIPVDTLDAMLEPFGHDQIDLISITTNGSEREIIEGMSALFASRVKYIALARTGEGYHELMASHGYQFFSHDDRGFVFIHESYV